jgi:hypothetical protein
MIVAGRVRLLRRRLLGGVGSAAGRLWLQSKEWRVVTYSPWSRLRTCAQVELGLPCNVMHVVFGLAGLFVEAEGTYLLEGEADKQRLVNRLSVYPPPQDRAAIRLPQELETSGVWPRDRTVPP